MRIVVDTGVFSAALSKRRRTLLADHVVRMSGNQIFLATQTVMELRYGVLVAGWANARVLRLEAALARTTVVPVTESLVRTAAELRARCRHQGHALQDRAHGNDLWIAASAVHLAAPLLTADGVFLGAPGLQLVPTG